MKKRIIAIVLILTLLVVGGLLASKALKGKQETVSWYSEDKTEYVIETADQLYDLVTLSEKYDLTGKTFKLGADIVVNEGNAADWAENAPERKWYPIKNFSGTFDGQGHTISGLYASIYDKAMGLFTDTKSGAVIKDFKLVNTYFKVVGSPGTAAIAGGVNNVGTFEKIYTDAIIDCDGNLTGGLVSTINGESTISECWFDGTIIRYFYNHTGGGIVAQVNTTTLNMEHCLSSGTIVADKAKDWIRIGGLCGLIAGRGHLNATDCLITGTIDSVTTKQVGSAVGFVGTSSSGKFDSVFATKEAYGVAVGNGDDRIQGGVIRLEEKNITGFDGYSWTNLDFDNYWTVDKDGTPILKHFAEEVVSVEGVAKKYDTDWYTGTSGFYTINTREELYGFSLLSASKDFSGVVVQLGSDIVINEGDAKDWEKEAPDNFWIPVVNWGGIFDGQGHTISGVYMDGEGTMGLFLKTKMDSIVKNFRLTNSYFNNQSTSTAFTGSIAGIAGGEFNTIYSDAIITSTGIGAGGIVGSVSIGKPKIINCWFDGSIAMKGETGYTAAGIVASVTIPTEISHCLNTGSISAERTENYNRLGGMAGVIGTSSILTITDSLNVGKITAGKVIEGKQPQTGSLIGFIGTSSGAKLDTVCMTLESYNVAVGQGEDRCVGLPIQYATEEVLGIRGYQWTNLDFTDYWVAVKDSTPQLKSFASAALSTAGVARKFDISWYKEEQNTFVITDAQDLYGVAMLTSAGIDFKGKTIKVSKDIVVNAGDASTWATNPPTDSWIPIANFLGTFDGQGHSISGLYKNGGTNIGLFANAKEETVIKNVIVENSYFANKTSTGNVYIGGIVAQGGGTIDTVYSDVIIETTGVGAGGILACANIAGAKISNAWFAGEIKLLGETGYSGSGIVAIVQQNIALTNCLNSGKLSAERTEKYTRIGGLIGVIGNKSTATIKGSMNVGEIDSVKKQAGSLIGFLAANVVLDANVYATNESYATQIGQKTGELKGSVNKVGIATLKGEKAKVTAAGLDYSKYWMTLSKRTPILSAFASKAPVVPQRGMKPDTSWYNKTDKTFVITTAEQLHGLAELSYDTDFAGVTIKLGADIIVNTGDVAEWKQTAPKYVWEPIQTFAGTFDGQGYTISGLYNADGKNTGLFGETTEKAVIKNFSLKNTYFANNEATGLVYIGSVAGQGAGTFENIYSNAILESTGQGVAGFVGCVNVDGMKFNQCWFDGSVTLHGENAYSGGAMVGILNGDTEIKDCLNTGAISNDRTSDYNRLGSIAGLIANTSTVTVENFLNVGTVTAGKVVEGKNHQAGSVAGFIASGSELHVDGLYTTTESNKVTLGQNRGKLVGAISSAKLENYLGKDAFATASTLDYKNVWAALEGKTPILRSFIGSEIPLMPTTYDTSWYDEETLSFTITTVEQLYALAELSKEYDFKGQTFILGSDITVNELASGQTAKDWLTNGPEKVWTPIGSEKPFAGTFDGQGYAIRGLYVGSGINVGLFAKTTENAVIKNLKLLDSCFVNYSATGVVNFGSIVGQGGGKLDTIYSDAIVATTGNTFGGLIGSVNIVSDKNMVINCWFAGELILKGSDAHTAGGIVGEVGEVASTSTAGLLVITNCLVDNRSDAPQVTSTVRTNWLRLGGIVGMVFRSGTTVTLEDNMVLGTFSTTSNSNIGSIVGRNGETLNYGTDTYVLKSVYKNISGNPGIAANDTNSIANVETLYGWEATETASQLDFTTYWAPIKDSTPVLRSFIGNLEEAEEPTTPPVEPEEPEEPSDPKEITEYNKTDKEFTIKNVEQLYKFVELSQTNDFAGQTIYLVNDIVVNRLAQGQDAEDWAESAPSKTWTPISSASNYPFKGTFDGQGYTISGLYASGTTLNNFGLFGRMDGGTIKNVRLTDTYFGIHKSTTKPANVFSGSILGSGNGTIQNVYSNAIVSSNKGIGLGGIVGTGRSFTEAKDLVLEACWFDGKVILTSGAIQGGGMLGMTYADNLPKSVSITNCLNTGSITQTGTNTSYKYDRIGGMAGLLSGAITVSMTDCLNVGTISGDTNQFGAIFGMSGSSTNVVLTDVYAMTGSCSNYYGTCSNTSLTITANFVAEADLKGDNAKTSASGLDYEKVWLTQEGKTPILKVIYDMLPDKTLAIAKMLSATEAIVAKILN